MIKAFPLDFCISIYQMCLASVSQAFQLPVTALSGRLSVHSLFLCRLQVRTFLTKAFPEEYASRLAEDAAAPSAAANAPLPLFVMASMLPGGTALCGSKFLTMLINGNAHLMDQERPVHPYPCCSLLGSSCST